MPVNGYTSVMAYTKLDSGITESTIWQAPDATRLVWITMLARADQNGYVGASMPGLAGLARVTLEACIEAIRTLESPDTWSRTQAHEGRRIAPAEGGWVLLNHAKYREKQSADDRRERSRVAMAALRAKRKSQASTGANALAPVNGGESKLSQAEAEAEATRNPPTPRRGSVHGFPPGFEVVWAGYPRKVGKDAAAKAFAKRKPDKDLIEAMVKAIETQRASDQWCKDGGQFIPHLSTWLNEGRWQDEAPGSESDIFARGAL